MSYAKTHNITCAINVRMDAETHALWRDLVARIKRTASPGVRLTNVAVIRKILDAANEQLNHEYNVRFPLEPRPEPEPPPRKRVSKLAGRLATDGKL